LKALPLSKLFASEDDQENSQDNDSSSIEICPYEEEDPNEDIIGHFNSVVEALPVVDGDIKIDLNELLFSKSTSVFEPDEEGEEEAELLNIENVKSSLPDLPNLFENLRKVSCENLGILQNFKCVLGKGQPKNRKTMVGDGNCAFRALSYSVT